MNLSNLFAKGKTWDKHKANADKIAKYYTKGNKSYLHRYAQRVGSCANWLKFQLVAEKDGLINLQLSDARFCRVRHCPICQWRRSLYYSI